MMEIDDVTRWARAGTRVAERMKERGGLSIADLARLTGLSRETISEIVHGRPRRRTPSTLAKVCVVLGWTADSLDQILDGEEPTELTRQTQRAAMESVALIERIQEGARAWMPETDSEAIARLTEENAQIRERFAALEKLVRQALGEETAPTTESLTEPP